MIKTILHFIQMILTTRGHRLIKAVKRAVTEAEKTHKSGKDKFSLAFLLIKKYLGKEFVKISDELITELIEKFVKKL